MKKYLCIFLLTIVFWAHQCVNPDYSIDIKMSNGKLRTLSSTPGSVFESSKENPLIYGHVRIPHAQFKRGSTCCSRIFMKSTHDVFLESLHSDSKKKRSFVKLLSSDSHSGDSHETIYHYEVPPLCLPSNGDVVELTLNVDGIDQASCKIKLIDSIIVLPVHFHVFKAPNRNLEEELGSINLSTILDSPDFRVTAGTTVDPNSSNGNRFLTNMITKAYVQNFSTRVDEVFEQAGIQFKAVSYEIIDDEDLEKQIIGVNAYSLKVDSYHRERQSIPGIHVYLGRNEQNYRNIGRTGRIPCEANLAISLNPAIVIDWKGSKDSRSIYTLAHELGHYLGLDHVDDLTFTAGKV